MLLIKIFLAKIQEKLSSLYIEKAEVKIILKKRPIFISIVISVLSVTGINIYFSMEKEKSVIATSSKPLHPEYPPQKELSYNPEIDSLFESPTRRIKRKKRRFLVSFQNKQVLVRHDTSGIPSGTKIIARLITPIDTRIPSTEVLATVASAMIFNDEIVIPKNSIIHGIFNHNKERIFINFKKCIFPDGRESPITAHALDTKTFQTGIQGIHHKKAVGRITKSVALGMVSPMAQTLTQKEALGRGYVITPKSTLKNAFLQGLAQSSEGETKRLIRETGDDRDYLTLQEGTDIIVVLLAPFRQKKHNP